jgi:hypothetical protein
MEMDAPENFLCDILRTIGGWRREKEKEPKRSRTG